MMKCLWFGHLWIICFVKIILFIPLILWFRSPTVSLILWGEKWNDFLITWCFTIKHNLYSVLFLSKSSNFMPITTQALRTRIHFLSVFRSVKAPLGPQSRISWISETFFTFSRSWRRRASSCSTWRKTFEKKRLFSNLDQLCSASVPFPIICADCRVVLDHSQRRLSGTRLRSELGNLAHSSARRFVPWIRDETRCTLGTLAFRWWIFWNDWGIPLGPSAFEFALRSFFGTKGSWRKTKWAMARWQRRFESWRLAAQKANYLSSGDVPREPFGRFVMPWFLTVIAFVTLVASLLAG